MATKVKQAPRRQSVRAKRLSLFATPLAVCLLPEAAEAKSALSALILACYQEGNPAGDAHGITGRPWQGPFCRAAEGIPELEPLYEAATVLAEAMQPGPTGPWGVSWRVEVLHPGQGFEVEGIKGGLWCASYLVDGGGGERTGGQLELQDPRGAAAVMYAPGLTFAAQGGETLGVTQSIGLKEGALIVFPAWLLQSTSLHQGTDARLSLSLLLGPRSPGG